MANNNPASSLQKQHNPVNDCVKVVSDMLAGALDKALSPFSACASENGALLLSLQYDNIINNINCQAASVDSLSTKVDTFQGAVCQTKKDANNYIAELHKLQLRADELEDRERRKNIRIVNLPMGIEKDNAVPENHAAKMDPSTMIFQLLWYPHLQAILQGTRKAKPSLPNGTQFEFYPDYSGGTTQRRSAFKGVRAKFRQRGIDNLIYPATLWIKVNRENK